MIIRKGLQLLQGDVIQHIDDQRDYNVLITMKSGLELQLDEDGGCGLICVKGHYLVLPDGGEASLPYMYCPQCKVGWDSVEDFLQHKTQKWSKQWVLNT